MNMGKVSALMIVLVFLTASIILLLAQPVGATTNNATTATVPVGTEPSGIAVTSDSNFVYVANSVSGTVSVISAATNAVTATITVGGSPSNVAINGTNVYVTNTGSNSVSVIDTTTNTVTATIMGFTGPSGLAITPDGKFLYVANSGSGTVSVVNIATKTITATIMVDQGPNGIVVTPNGKYVYVANTNGATVSVISTTTNTLSDSVIISDHGPAEIGTPVGLAIDPVYGASVYITNTADDRVFALYTVDNSLFEHIFSGNGPTGVAVTPDSKYALVTNTQDNTLALVSTASNSLSVTLAVGNSPNGVAVSPNGNYAYVANTASNSVSVIKMAIFLISPTVSVLPNYATGGIGQAQTFTASVSGGSGVYSSYQWYVNGAAQSGQTTSTFSYIPSTGIYSIAVMVIDSAGTSALSPNATLIVLGSGIAPTPTPTPTATTTPTYPSTTQTPTPVITSTPTPATTFSVTPLPSTGPTETPFEKPKVKSTGSNAPLIIAIILALIAIASFISVVYVKRGKQKASSAQENTVYKLKSSVPITKPTAHATSKINQPVANAPQPPFTRTCPHCKRTVRDDLNVCPYCLKRLR